MRIKYLTATLIVMLLLCSCEKEPSPPSPPMEESIPAVSTGTIQTEHVEKQEFSLSYNSLASLDPLVTTDSLNLALAGLVYEGLFQLDDTFAAQPLLCASYTRDPSCSVWSFSIREDVRFSDGTPLTASHVSASLQIARNSQIYRSRLSQVSEITSAQNTVTIKLSTPNGNLPSLLDIPITLTTEDDLPPLGTGLYYYESEETHLILRRNPCYRDASFSQAVEIPLYSASAYDQRVSAFDSGLVSLTTADFSSPSALGFSCDYEVWDCPTTSMLYIIYQCRSDFCSDPALRKALSLSLDRAYIANSLLLGAADSSSLPVSPYCALYDADLAKTQEYNPEYATQFLEENGYYLNAEGALFTPDKKQVKLSLLVNADNSYRVSIARFLAEDLMRFGISVEVNALPWGSYTKALEAGSFDLCLAQTKLTADFDLSPFLNDDQLNYGRYADMDGEKPVEPENSLTASLLAAASAATGTNRVSAYQDIFEHLSTTNPFTPLCFTRTSALVRWGVLNDMTMTQQNLFYLFQNWEFR